MQKYVRESTAAKSLSVYVILKGARHVATVQTHYAAGSGRVTVDVWQQRDAAKRSAAKAPNSTSESMSFQSGRAGGYGYDKFTAALSGLWIDGHIMTDHCGHLGVPRKPAGGYTGKARRGYSFANYRDGAAQSCFRNHGLTYLESIGYTVIQGI